MATINHAETLRFLKQQGYRPAAIRKAIAVLEEITHGHMAAILGTQRKNVTNHINMVPYRKTPEIQKGIAAILQVPREEFFEAEENHSC